MAFTSRVIPRDSPVILAVFNRILYPGQLEGFFFTLFSIGVSAAESAVAIAIIINVYRNFKSDQVNSIENMKW